jgi:threonine dehydratase
MDKYVKDILSAKVYDVAVETPIERAEVLSQRLQNTVLLKREDLQPVHSFKLRGAYNKMAGLSAEAAKKGVIAASAGNHAQGVAMAGSRLGIHTTIVMPVTTPMIKINAVKTLGGKVILHGDTYDEAFAHANTLIEQKGYTFVHAFDDPAVIAGQGTVGLEIVRQHSGNLDAIFVPVGGGGLMAGIAAYVKFIRPEIKLIAVEAEDSACLQAALAAKRRVVLPQVGLFADGVAVAQVGKEPFRVLRKLVDEVVTVTTDEICAAVKDVFEDTRAMAEPAGALAVAGLKKYVREHSLTGKDLMALVTGANVNFDRLRHISERTELGESREAILAVTLDERPGSFRRFSKAIGKRYITEFNYRYGDPQRAKIFVGVRLADAESSREKLLEMLRSKRIDVVDMTDNEAAKLHIRYMVGGRNQAIDNERVYRFEFPERPGAFTKFLDLLGGRWNISMFHYRNHGAAYGRVLCGMQVPPKQVAQFEEFMRQIGYRCWDETENEAYKTFLVLE